MFFVILEIVLEFEETWKDFCSLTLSITNQECYGYEVKILIYIFDDWIDLLCLRWNTDLIF